MPNADDPFLAGANPILAVALVRDVVVIVVEDADDDELTSVFAEATNVPADGFGGAWSAQVDEEGTTAKFHLIRLGGSVERQWTIRPLPAEILTRVINDTHYAWRCCLANSLATCQRRSSRPVSRAPSSFRFRRQKR
jgi:hypothetical protein